MILLAMAAVSAGAYSQAHGVQAGAKVGANMWSGTDLKSQVGLTYGIEAAYTCRWTINRDIALGPKVGAAFVHSAGGLGKDDLYEQFVNTDYLRNEMAYTVQGSVKQKFSNWQLEVPLMLSMNIHNALINVGAKFMYLVSGQYEQTLSDNLITATYTAYHVDVTNELITGVVTPEQTSFKGDSYLPKMHVLLGVEAGYQWEVADKHFIGLMAYFNYGVWSSNSTVDKAEQLIEVGEINRGAYPVAPVRVNQLQSVYSPKVNYIDFGVKLIYQFEYSDYHYHGWHRGQ